MRKFIAALAGAVALAGLSPAAKAQSKPEINYVYATPSAYYWDVFAAAQLGHYEAEGLKVNLIKADNVSQQMQMLVTNSVQIAGANAELVVTAVDKGARLTMIAGETAKQGFTFVVRPEIKTWADLKGKTLGVTQLQEASATMLELLLKKNGVDRKDYQTIALGGTPNRYAALTRGAVAGTLLSAPADFKAVEQGMRKMGQAYEAFPGPQVVFTVQKDWAAKNADAVVSFLRATNKAMGMLYDKANRDKAADILVKAIGGTKDEALQSYDLFFGEEIMARNLDLTREGVKAHLDLRGSSEDPDKYYDLTYLKRAR
ncbi:MAG: ABC-type nitrate/sulfonate/bicarbonate transport system periplasmic component-like protein [Hyphomicrobiales bacterium]|nr:ABC-type nitrate/sulfonate/bicarbonate transport system periplasmic component-like protein [Hyphomicrobiales bacterium]